LTFLCFYCLNEISLKFQHKFALVKEVKLTLHPNNIFFCVVFN